MKGTARKYLASLKNITGFLLILFFMASSLSHAQLFLDEVETMYIGETTLFSARQPTRVVIGNPDVARVINVSDKDISVGAEGVGFTTFVYWDLSGEHSLQIRVLTKEMTETKRRIDKLLGELKLDGVYTKSNNEEGRILLLGDVKTEEDKERIELALGDLKEETIDLIKIKDEGIVEIGVKVLELDRDAAKTLGFTWPGQIDLTEPDTTTKTAQKISSTFFDIADWTRNAFTLTIDMLVQEGKARVLSQPTLACLSGKEAELLVGGEKPIITTQVQAAVGSSTTVEYKEYGIKLNISPTISDNNRIYVALQVEVSEVGVAETIGDPDAPTARAYPLTKRNVATELFLNDGQTLAIGGLIKQKKEVDIRKVPFLGDVPILGALFRKRQTTGGGGQGERGDIELFITLTPSIVAKPEATVEVSKLSSMADIPIEGDIPEELKDYVRDVQTRIVKAAYYPPEAKALGWEGIVRLDLLIDDDGRIKEANILESSGYSILDEAAIDVVKRQSPYPSFPQQIKLFELRLEVPIAYRKDN